MPWLSPVDHCGRSALRTRNARSQAIDLIHKRASIRRRSIFHQWLHWLTASVGASTKSAITSSAITTATSTTVRPVRQLVRFACRTVVEEVCLGDEGVRRLSAVPKVATISATAARPSVSARPTASVVTAAVTASTSRGTLPHAIAAVIAAIAVATLAAGATSAHPHPVLQVVRASRRQLAGEVRLVEQHMLCMRLMPITSFAAAAATATLAAAPSQPPTTVPALATIAAVGAIATGHAGVHCGFRYEAGLAVRRLVRGSCIPLECKVQLGDEPLLRMRRLPLAFGRQLGGMHGVGHRRHVGSLVAWPHPGQVVCWQLGATKLPLHVLLALSAQATNTAGAAAHATSPAAANAAATPNRGAAGHPSSQPALPERPPR